MARQHSQMADEQQPLRQLFDGYCANVYAEALGYEKRNFPSEIRDLFMEQIGLCGEAGYTQMAQWRWLPLIMSWERSSGCYGFFFDEQVDEHNFDYSTYGKVKRGLSRRKRVEQIIAHKGCLSHRTSVAQSALLAYVRRLVEYVAAQTSFSFYL